MNRRIVLVHGGMHGSWCWQKLIPLLEGEITAVDLPGRTGGPQVVPTLESWADTVIGAASEQSVLVAHSLGGLAALAAAGRAPERVAHIVFVAAAVPRNGQCYWDLLPKPLDVVRRALHIGDPEIVMPRPAARLLLCNGLDRPDRMQILSRLVPESSAVLGSAVHYRLADSIGLTYVHTTRDRMIRRREQSRYVETLPNRVRRLWLDCGHSAPFARPGELAAVINRL